MASVSTDANGNRRIFFKHPQTGKRSIIYVGKMPMKEAETTCGHIEKILWSIGTNTTLDPTGKTAEWLCDIGEDLHGRLVVFGLTQPRESIDKSKSELDLIDFVDGYIAERTDVAPNTRKNYLQAKKYLAEFFTSGMTVQGFTPADADRFKIHLHANYAEATAAGVIKKASKFFTAARRGKLVTENPFEGVKAGRMDNQERQHFVTQEVTETIIDECPNLEWRGIVALCRYGGLRCPSELLELTVDDVLWNKHRFHVRSPKLAGTKKEHRHVPIFPELERHLLALVEAVPEGSRFLITKSRDPKVNWRTTFKKIIKRAGFPVAWPRLFQNLRSSRQTELVELWPAHLVSLWLGNSEKVADRHYLQVLDSHFESAASGDKSNKRQSATHFPTHPGAVRRGTESESMISVSERTLENGGKIPVGVLRDYSGHDNLEGETIPPRGVEPLF